MQVAFTFDAENRGINDTVVLPALRGQILDATCYFTSSRCWFLVSTQDGGRTINRCFVLKRDGTVEASAEAEEGDGSWLETIRAKAAATLTQGSAKAQKGGGPLNGLFAATDSGLQLVRIDDALHTVTEAARWPDTKGVIDANHRIFFAPQDGIYAVSDREVLLLQVS